MDRIGRIGVLALKELRVLARDRQAAVLLFGMPAVFVFFLSLALKDVYAEKVGTNFPIVLEVEDDGQAGEDVAAELGELPGLRIVERPGAIKNDELFRSGAARAAIRIPAGFSVAIEALLDGAEIEDLGAARIQWEVSPTIDAAYRSTLEAALALTCMRVMQTGLAQRMSELGAEMDEMGGQLQLLSEKLEFAVSQLESTAAQLGGSTQDVQEFAIAAAAERAASAEASAARDELLRQGFTLQDLGLSSAPSEAALTSESAPIETQVIEVAEEVGDPLSPEERRQVDEMLARAEERRNARKSAPRALPQALSSSSFLNESMGERRVLPTPLQQTVPGWSLFAMFFIVVPLSSALHRERNEGTLRRLRAMATPRDVILFGKLVPYVLIGVVQFAGMLAVGMFLVPAVSDLSLDLGAQPLVLLPITFAAAFAATAYGLFVSAFTRTPEQAAAFGATSVVILAVLGGVMIPHFVMPALMQKLALASPLYWGHKAYLDAFLYDAGFEQVATSVYALCGFGLVCLALAARRVAA